MENPKFQILPKKYIEDSSVISMRLPKDMLADIDIIAKSSGRTRNEILMLSLEFALNNVELMYNEKIMNRDIKKIIEEIQKQG